jgi:hypothetical protein
MERLYLIRVGMERFLGPYTLKQVQEAYSKMQFGLQDEISGSLRQWVAFDNIEGIRRHYPELVHLIHTEMMSGWGMTVPPTASSPNARVRMSGQSFDRPRSSSKMPLILAAFALVIAALIAFVSYRDGDWVNPIAYLKDRSYYQAKSLLGDKYNVRFEAYIDRNRSEINSAMKKKKSFALWIPYVRAVAFASEREGRWEGVSAKKLRGGADSFLPQDCSVAAWDERWKASRGDWSAFLEGRRLPKEEWSQILIMDTHWIKNRSPMAGWMDPGSYHEACLRMAAKAMEKYAPEDGNAKTLLARMRWQLSTIAGNSPSAEYEMSGTLWAASCLEDAHAPEDLKACLNSVKAKGDWQDHFEATMDLRKLALLAQEGAQLSETDGQQLSGLLSTLASKKSELILDYEAEMKFYQEIIQQKGNVKAAKALVQRKFPSVRFEP